MTKQPAIVKAALAVAKLYPVFPTDNKKPCWSNKELGVKKGEGGYKIATQDHDKVIELFSHRRATEIAVPMGAMSGLLCVDVDIYKGGDLENWITSNVTYLDTLTHETRSGGLHYIFEHPGDNVRFPATLREGVDLKAGGNGYICWPGTAGYKALNKKKPMPFPMELLKAAMLAKGGTGSVTALGSYNNSTDADLIKQIEQATELYPALRSLAYRMPGRRQDNGTYFSEVEMVNILENLMDTSVAASEGHVRHDDWVDRRGKISDLVLSAIDKEKGGGINLSEAEIAAISQGESFIKAQKMIAASSRPIGPQRETKASDIEKRVAEMTAEATKEENDTVTTSDFVSLDAKQLRSTTLPPIKWLVPSMIAEGGTVSLAGMSNVGKTRYMAALVMALAVGDTKRLGLPQCTGKISTLYIANEEHVEDMARRFKAVTLQHDDKDSAEIVVRGKAAGTFRLVAVNETGSLEIDEANVAILVDEIRKHDVKLLALDPYVTLSDGGADENSAATASMVTKAFLLIISMTNCAVFYPHHTPKDRSKDADAFRGDASAWRGSGAIYSSLDCGFTLCNWYPRNKDHRKAWKAQYLTAKLSRFIVLDTGKIREGEAIEPTMLELVGQDMDEGEGDPIGVCCFADEAQAANALLDVAADTIAAAELAYAMVNRLGEGEHEVLATIHNIMKGHPVWPNGTRLQGRDLEALCSGAFTQRWVMAEDGYSVKFVSRERKGTAANWSIVIKKEEPEVE